MVNSAWILSPSQTNILSFSGSRIQFHPRGWNSWETDAGDGHAFILWGVKLCLSPFRRNIDNIVGRGGTLVEFDRWTLGKSFTYSCL